MEAPNGVLRFFLFLGLLCISGKLSLTANGLQLRAQSSLWEDRTYAPAQPDADEAWSPSALVDLSSVRNEGTAEPRAGADAASTEGNAFDVSAASAASTAAQAADPSSETGEPVEGATSDVDAQHESAGLAGDSRALTETRDAEGELLGHQNDSPTPDGDDLAEVQSSDADAGEEMNPSDAPKPSPVYPDVSSFDDADPSETAEAVTGGDKQTGYPVESATSASNGPPPTPEDIAAGNEPLNEPQATLDAAGSQLGGAVTGAEQANDSAADTSSALGTESRLADDVPGAISTTSADEPEEFQGATSPAAAQEQPDGAWRDGTPAENVPSSLSGYETKPAAGETSTAGALLAPMGYEGHVPVAPAPAASSSRFRQWTNQFLGTGKEQFQLMQRTNVAEAAEKGAKNLRASMEILHNTTSFFSALRAQQRARRAAGARQQDTGSSVTNQLQEPGTVPLSEPEPPVQQEDVAGNTEPPTAVAAPTGNTYGSEEY